MATFWVTERKGAVVEESDEDCWQERVENLPDVEVLLHQGNRMKVKTGDEIALRMTCSDVCVVERISGGG